MHKCLGRIDHCWHIHNLSRKQPIGRTSIICCICQQERKVKNTEIAKLLDSPKAGLPMNKSDARWRVRVRRQFSEYLKTAGISESSSWSMPQRELPNSQKFKLETIEDRL